MAIIRDGAGLPNLSAPDHNVQDVGDATAQDAPHTRPAGRILDRYKCECCRKRKVRCIPQGRKWPDKCDQCQKMNLPCSTPKAADRTKKRRAQAAQQTASPTHNWVSMIPDDSEAVESTNHSVDSIMGLQENAISYQDLRDAVVLLGLHVLEYLVLDRQLDWLVDLLNGIDYDNHDLQVRSETINSLQRKLSQYISGLLQSSNISPIERTLLCQLLSDTRSPFKTPYEVLRGAPNFNHPRENGETVKTLIRSNDIGGAILLLHSLLLDCKPGQLDREPDLEELYSQAFPMLLRLGADFTRRMTGILELLDGNTFSTADPFTVKQRKVLEDNAVVILPYSVLAGAVDIRFETDKFTRLSFVWSWIRHSLMKTSNSGTSFRCSDLSPEIFFEMDDHGVEDGFGHSYLHIAVLTGSDYQALARAKRGLSGTTDEFLRSVNKCVQEGPTPLVYAAAVGSERTFAYLFHLSLGITHTGLDHPIFDALWMAASYGRLEMVRLLLTVPDSNLARRDQELLLALDIAEHHEVCQLIQAAIQEGC